MRAPERSVTVSWKPSVGVTAYRSAVAPVQPKIRSAISVSQLLVGGPPLQRDGAVPQAGQEPRQRGADLGPAVEPRPVHPELADQRVAHVDRDQEDLVAEFGAVYQDGLDIGGHLAEQRMARGDPVPGRQVELALGRAGRARVSRYHPADRRVEEEERHRHRDLQFVPVLGAQRSAWIVIDALGYRPVPAACRPLMCKKQITRAAGTGQ